MSGIKLKLLPQFPASVYGDIGIDVEKSNGTFTIDLDYSKFSPVSTPPDPSHQYTLLWNVINQEYTLVPIGSFAWTDAPADSQVYGRLNNAWVPIVSGAYLLIAGHQTTTGGFCFTSYNIGTVLSGTVTPNAMNGNYQYYSNGGAHTLAAPGVDCAIDILMTNVSGAGAVTFTGFTVGSTGDALTTIVGNKFVISVRAINAVATYIIKALQ